MMLTRMMAAVAAVALAVGPQAVPDAGGEADGTRVTAVQAGMSHQGTRVTGGEVGPERHRLCTRSFDRAARRDMELFRDYEAQAWREMHHPDAETVFASGFRAVGVDDIMTALAAHFEDREAIFEWTELSRHIDQTCTSGLIVYETRYRVPSIGFDQTAYTTVMFIRDWDDWGQWKVIYDQGTEVPAS